MNADHDNDTRFDDTMRQWHAASLERLQPATRIRLQTARRDALTARQQPGPDWGLAGTAVAVAVLAVGLFAISPWLRPDTRAPRTEVATAGDTVSDAVIADAILADEVEAVMASLDEDPDFYLWLAANDDTQPPALER